MVMSQVHLNYLNQLLVIISLFNWNLSMNLELQFNVLILLYKNLSLLSRLSVIQLAKMAVFARMVCANAVKCTTEINVKIKSKVPASSPS